MFDVLDNIREKLNIKIPKDKMDEIFAHLQKVYPDKEDPWGLDLHKARKTLEWIYPLYKQYFKVRVFGQENVGNKNYLIVSNHSGQIAIDAMLVSTSFVLEVDPPRILRPMVERFVPSLPFIGTLFAEGGAVLGDRQNCLNLLNRGQSVLVFPEGVRGVAKSTADYYRLQRFTRGFFRMALSANVNIIPVAVIGAEEMFPWVYHPKSLIKFLGLPALPLTPLYFPLPSPVDIYIGEEYVIPDELSPESPDNVIDKHIEAIENRIKKLTAEGLTKRRKFWANIVGPRK